MVFDHRCAFSWIIYVPRVRAYMVLCSFMYPTSSGTGSPPSESVYANRSASVSVSANRLVNAAISFSVST